MRVQLQIQRRSHDLSQQLGLNLDAVRVYAHIALPLRSGKLDSHRVIVDTGAPLSMFPRRMWQDIAHTAIGKVRVGGVEKRDECRVSATIAVLECALLDDFTKFRPVQIHAYLADSNEVPALLGMSGLLESVRIVVDVPADEAYCEM